MKNYNPNPLAAGLAFALLRGVGIILIGIAGNFWTQYADFVHVLGRFYIGYSTTIIGIIIGFLWSLVAAFVGAFVVVWLYNKINKLIQKE